MFILAMADGRKGEDLSAACGLSGRKGRVGQEACRRMWSVGSSLLRGSRGLSAGVVCRRENGEWVKRIVDGVWSVGAKRASGSRSLSLAFGLSA